MFPSTQMPWSLSYTSSTIPAGFPYLAGPRGPSASAQPIQFIHPPAPIQGCVALPAQTRSGREAVLHPTLQYSSSIRSLHAKWDLSGSFEGLTRRNGLRARTTLSELATQPALPSMTVVHPLLPWCITVHQLDSRGVTVADVLQAIYLATGMGLEGGRGTRLQYLRGSRILVGLRKSGLGGDVWEMVVV